MRKLVLIIVLSFFFPLAASAYEIVSDPQYVVVNFADLYYVKWAASSKAWNATEKPKALSAIKQIMVLIGRGNSKRQLAWSTLLEYTDFPVDTPSRNSPYLVRLRRILELAEELNLPVFIPLNGVQWWNEMPDLWNFWDFDGNQTPGCGNDEYMIPGRCAFPKLKDPEYRTRFIRGYNPENKWNVEWENWETPMKFNSRNWGGGDVLVAPPMNLVNHGRTKLVLKKIQSERFETIVKELVRTINSWEKKGKAHLFAGISIGTEVSLNASPTAGDENFLPRGFRALQDTFCPKDKPTCGANQHWSTEKMHEMRKEIIFTYFNDMAQRAIFLGLPKQRIYTHVWSEAEPGEQKYTDALGASVTLYSRPGLSLYGKAEEPFNFSVLTQMLRREGYPAWAAPEFSPLIKESPNWYRALSNTLDDTLSKAQLIDIYNERDIINTPAIPVLKSFLNQEPHSTICSVSETVIDTKRADVNPKKLKWHFVNKKHSEEKIEILTSFHVVPKKLSDLSVLTNSVSTLPYGAYFWTVKVTGCGGKKWTLSTPRSFVRLPEIKYEENKWQQMGTKIMKKILNIKFQITNKF